MYGENNRYLLLLAGAIEADTCCGENEQVKKENNEKEIATGPTVLEPDDYFFELTNKIWPLP